MNPKKLTPHPLLSALPRIPEELPATQAFLDDVRAHGIRDAILVDGENRILDGVRRWEAARQLDLDVEIKVVPAGSEVAAILGNLTQRRHLSKGQLAYTAFPLLKPALDEAKEYRLACLRRGDKSPVVDSIDYGKGTVEDLARSLGFGRDQVFQAKQLHEAAASDEDLRAFVEESIFVGGHGLGAVLAGIAGQQATRGKPRPTQILFDFSKVAASADTFCKRWSKPEIWSADHIHKTREALEESFAHMPPEALDEIEATVKRLKKGARA